MPLELNGISLSRFLFNFFFSFYICWAQLNLNTTVQSLSSSVKRHGWCCTSVGNGPDVLMHSGLRPSLEKEKIIYLHGESHQPPHRGLMKYPQSRQYSQHSTITWLKEPRRHLVRGCITVQEWIHSFELDVQGCMSWFWDVCGVTVVVVYQVLSRSGRPQWALGGPLCCHWGAPLSGCCSAAPLWSSSSIPPEETGHVYHPFSPSHTHTHTHTQK